MAELAELAARVALQPSLASRMHTPGYELCCSSDCERSPSSCNRLWDFLVREQFEH